MRSAKKLVETTVEIDDLSVKGHGIGIYHRQDGIQAPIEVRFTIPGDHARVKVLRRRKGIHGSLFEELMHPSPQRIAPRCQHFGSCGGCRWQQIDYSQQLQIKQDRISQLFHGQVQAGATLLPIVPCDPPWRYRNKMEFTFSASAEGQQYLGLVLDIGRGRAFNIEECHLCSPWFVEAAEKVRSWWQSSDLHAYHPPRNTGSLRSLTLREGRRTGDRMAILTVSGSPDYALTREQLEEFKHVLEPILADSREGAQYSLFLRIQQTARGMPTNFYEMHLAGKEQIREKLYLGGEGAREELTFGISPMAFFQPNTVQAEALYSLALEMAQVAEGDIVYDLYCGTGTLGICAAKRAQQVISIELSPEAALDAKENVERNGLDNVSVICGDVGRELARLRQEPDFAPPHVVLVDPPRAGLASDAIEHLDALAAQKIVYISCNPKSQQANIAELIEKGYRLEKLQPVDQFPHTVHIENIALLTR